jgi:hypothetical protein
MGISPDRRLSGATLYNFSNAGLIITISGNGHTIVDLTSQSEAAQALTISANSDHPKSR